MTRAAAGAVLRIARRTAWRQRWRTLLVVLLVAAPVAIAGATASIMRASDLTPAERATQSMGTADLQVEAWGGDPGEATAFVDGQLDRAEVAEATRVRATWAPLGSDYTRMTDLDLASPLTAGMMDLVDGRAPTDAAHVVLTPQLALDLDVAVGDQVELGGPGTAMEVVGLVEDPAEVRARVAVTTPSGLDRLEASELLAADGGLSTSWLVATDAPEVVARDLQQAAQDTFGARLEEQYAAMEAQGDAAMADVSENGVPNLQARTRAEARMDWTDSSLTQTLWRPETVSTGVAALLLIEVVFIAGAAYATGTRRRLRELGLLASGGATVAHLRAVVVLEAAVTGLAGAGLGVLLGAGAVVLGRPTLQRFVGPRIEGLPLGSLDLLGPVIVAVLAVVAAAWLPARTAARVPTTTALQGRMPLSAPPRWLPPAGLALAVFGGLLAVVGFAGDSSSSGAVAIIGVGLTVLGTAMLTGPIVAALGTRADRLPATLRLVVRDAARQRTRAAAATSAALVLLLIPVAMGVAYATSATQSLLFGLPEPSTHVVVGDEQLVYAFGPYDGGGGTSVGEVTDPDPTLVDEAATQTGDGTRTAPIALLADGQDHFAWILDEGLAPDDEVVPGDGGYEPVTPDGVVPSARTMTMARATPELVDALDSGPLADALDRDGVAVLGARARGLSVRLPDGAAHPATEVPVPVPATGGFPRVLVSDEAADRVGLSTVGTIQLLVAPTPLDDATRTALINLTDNSGTGQAIQVGWGSSDPGWLPWAVGGVSLLVVLIVLGLVTALSATESDNDLGTMVAVGARPSLRRRFLGLQSLLYALVGGILAVPLGIGLNWATQAGRQYVQIGPFGTWQSGRVAVPWLLLAALVIGIPLINGLVTALGVRSTRPQPPRRIA